MTGRRLGVALLAALAGGCAGGQTPPAPAGGRLRAVVIRPISDTTRDTIRFHADASADRCASARGVLLSGVTGGNGVLLWLRPGDSASPGAYVYAAGGDTITPRSAVAAVRFLAGDMSRGLVLDSGMLEVTELGGHLAARLRGSGLGFPGAIRVSVEADFEAVSAPRDSVSCAVTP